jgi:hypothetical protein
MVVGALRWRAMRLEVPLIDELIDQGALALVGDPERLDARERVGGVELSKHFLQ